MLHPILQTLFLLAAGAAVYRLWRAASSGSRLLAWLVAGGVLLRVAAGVPLFWISYLRLPFARSLQLGNGFWWFASDATGYYERALRVLPNGFRGIIVDMLPRWPSVFYNKILATLIWLLGTVPSVGLLLNLVSYLATAAVIVWWVRRYDVPERIAAIPLLAIGYSPSWIVWSVQPLKDAFFCFWILSLAVALDQWLRTWREPVRRPRRIVLAGVLLAVMMYGAAGVRWYYAVVALLCAIVPIFSTAIDAAPFRRRRFAAAAGALLMLLVMAVAIERGAGPFLPDSVRGVLRFEKPFAAVVETVEKSRGALDSFVDANTRIRAGEVLQEQQRAKLEELRRTRLEAERQARLEAQRRALAPPPPPPATETVASAPPVQAPAPAVTQTAAPAPAPAVAAAEPAPPSEEDVAKELVMSDMPVTVSGRLVAGFAAMVLPHFMAEALGLISLGEARGLWWFANVDTILFDAFVILSLVVFFRGGRAAWRDPAAWYALAVSFVMACAIAYTISNFGALMRHRSMVISTLVLLPLIAHRARRPVAAEAEPVPERDKAAVCAA